MKKLVAMILALALVLSMTSFAVAEEKKYDLGGRTVTFANWSDMTPNPSSATYAEEVALIAEIEEKYNCKIEFQVSSSWHTHMQQALLSCMTNEKFADIIYLGGGYIGKWASNGFLYPLDEVVDLDNECWNTGKASKYELDGKNYIAMPAGDTVMSVYMLFNKRLVSECGIDPEEIYALQESGEWTWDKLLEYALKCTRVVNGEYVSYGIGAWGNAPVIPEYMMYSNNCQPALYEANGNLTYNLEDPAVLETLQFCYDLVNEYGVAYTGATDWGTWYQLWLEGKVAFYCCDAWTWDMYTEALSEDEMGLLFMPKGPNATDYMNMTGMGAGYVMQSCQEDPEAIGAIIQDYCANYDWRVKKTQIEIWEDKVFDDESLWAIEHAAEPQRVILRTGEENDYFLKSILWSDFGVMSKTPPRTWVTERRAEIEQAFADANTVQTLEELLEEIAGEEAAAEGETAE